jgi:preprotein translocase subunit SecG
MYTVVLALHVLCAFSLVILVLLQQGKGADAGAVMGAGGANTVFGVGGASSLMVRLTTGIAIAFMLTSVGLVRIAMVEGGQGGSKGDALAGSVMGSVGQAAPAAEKSASPGSSVSGGAEQAPAPVDVGNVPK